MSNSTQKSLFKAFQYFFFFKFKAFQTFFFKFNGFQGLCKPCSIQPIIEYSAPVWSPFTKIEIESIAKIQRNCTRYALHYLTIKYKERCEYLNIFLLSFWREITDIKLLFKLLFVSDFYTFLIFVASQLRDYKPESRLWSSHNGPLQGKTKTFKSFY